MTMDPMTRMKNEEKRKEKNGEKKKDKGEKKIRKKQAIREQGDGEKLRKRRENERGQFFSSGPKRETMENSS